MYIECTTLQPTYAHVYSPCLWDAYIHTPTICASTGMQCLHTSIRCSNSPRTSVPTPVTHTGMAGRVGVLVYPLPPSSLPATLSLNSLILSLSQHSCHPHWDGQKCGCSGLPSLSATPSLNSLIGSLTHPPTATVLYAMS